MNWITYFVERLHRGSSTISQSVHQIKHAAFPDVPYLAPEGFAALAGVPAQSLASPPAAWADEIAVLALAGKRERMREHVLLHRPTCTLIVADLAFRVTPAASLGLRIFAAVALIGGKSRETAMPRATRLTVRDRSALAPSRAALAGALATAGFPCCPR